MGASKIIWCEALRAAQLSFPVSVGKLPSQQNLFQIKRNLTGHLFPTYYYFDSQGSLRLKSYPGHTIRDGHKAFKNEVFKRFLNYTGMYVYDSDLSSCHVGVIMMFLTEQQAPLLYKSFTDKDLYLEIAIKLKAVCTELCIFSDKQLRKIIKIKCFSMLNGGGLTTKNSHTKFFIFMSKSRNTNASQEERLTTWLQNILTIDVHSEVAFSKLYCDYKTYLNSEGRIPLSKNMFSRHFRKIYESFIDENKIILANRKGIQIIGVKLKQIDD